LVEGSLDILASAWMEVSALRYQGGIGLHGRSPLLRLQSDERLISLTRRGNAAAFEVLVSRYHTRLLAFCRHLLGSREDAEDVLQEVLAAAFNAILADDRQINVRPWLYRIARNRSLNHLRRIQAIGVDSMDVHFSDNGASTADKVHDREQFRLLVGDIHGLPETQRTALVLREMDALSYEQIAEAMETTVPGVKSLLVRARISLADAAEARLLSCEDVRIELAEVAEGLRKRPTPLVKRHIRSCRRCGSFQGQLKHTNKALAALLPIGPMALVRQLFFVHLGHSAGAGSGATAASATGATGAGATAGATGAAAGPAVAVAGTAGSTAAFGSAGGLISAGAGAIATKAAAGLAAAAIVTAGAAVTVSHVAPHSPATSAATMAPAADTASVPLAHARLAALRSPALKHHHKAVAKSAASKTAVKGAKLGTPTTESAKAKSSVPAKKKAPAGRTQAQSDPTVLPTATPPPSGSSGSPDTNTSGGSSTTPSGSTTPAATSSPATTTSTPTSSDQPSSNPSGSTSTTPTDGGSSTTTIPTGTTTPPDTTGSGSSTGTVPDPLGTSTGVTPTDTTGATSTGTTDVTGAGTAPLF
jgi:RNA polymerase sigma factor (sigma-70 family)